jgi:hypothetical protein
MREVNQGLISLKILHRLKPDPYQFAFPLISDLFRFF